MTDQTKSDGTLDDTVRHTHAGIGTLWDPELPKPSDDGGGHQDQGGIRDAADEFLEQPGTILDPIPEPDDRDR